MIFTGLTVLVFLLLLVLLMLLLRNILKLYVGETSSPLGARLRTRMVLGAVLIALTPAVCMFLFSFNLMNRSIDRWFSPNTSELREDSTRVVLELAQYVTDNARVEAESIAATGAADRDLPELNDELNSRRITLSGGFAMVYAKDQHRLASFQVPAETSQATLLPWLPENGQSSKSENAIALHGPISVDLLSAAQRRDEAEFVVNGQEYALGIAVTASGKGRRRGPADAQGVKPDGDAHSLRRRRILAALPIAQADSQHVLPPSFADHRVRVFLQRLAGSVSLQADHASG